MLGDTICHEGHRYVVALFNDPADQSDDRTNSRFESWLKRVEEWKQRSSEGIDQRRIAYGMDSPFEFLKPVEVKILGPFEDLVVDPSDDKEKPGLRWFEDAGHTINGHSIALRLSYGNVRFALTGDLNRDSMQFQSERLDNELLEAEIVKAPHHGSDDFDFDTLKRMKPVVSLISSGDESAFKEHIHPRATLVSAMGKVSRGDTSLLLCTELVAFFAKQDYSHTRKALKEFFSRTDLGDFVDVDDEKINVEDLVKLFGGNPTSKRKKNQSKALPFFLGFKRTNFGLINIRTDGNRVLVFTLSGRRGRKEAYAFTVDNNKKVEFVDLDEG